MILNQSYKYLHLTTGTATVGNVGSILHTITVNNPGTTNTITVTDGSSTIAVIAAVAGTFAFDVTVATSLTVAVSATCDITVSYL